MYLAMHPESQVFVPSPPERSVRSIRSAGTELGKCLIATTAAARRLRIVSAPRHDSLSSRCDAQGLHGAGTSSPAAAGIAGSTILYDVALFGDRHKRKRAKQRRKKTRRKKTKRRKTIWTCGP